MSDYYRDDPCPKCGRHRVQANGVCEKCRWNVDANDFEPYPEEPPSPLEILLLEGR